MLARMGKPFGAAAEQIAATVRDSEVIASDETSARVKGKTHWQWTFGCATAVYHVIAPTRGKDAPDRIGGAAGGERHDQRDWPGRPILGWKSLRHHRRRRQRDRQSGHREASSQEA
jgi:hypothetical protein